MEVLFSNQIPFMTFINTQKIVMLVYYNMSVIITENK